ncbi:MAG: hypothetical protein ACRDTA_23935 [Pseudonocardiaceae bacterium]
MTKPTLATLLAQSRRFEWELSSRCTVAEVKKTLSAVFGDLERLLDPDRAEPAGETDQDPDSGDEARRRYLVIQLLRSAIIGTLLSVQAAPDPPSWAGSAPAGEQRSSRRRDVPFIDRFLGVGDRRLSGPEDRTPPPASAQPSIVTSTLRDQMGGAFERADELLAKAQPRPPETVARDLAADRGLIDIVHELLEAATARDSEHTLLLIGQLKKDLRDEHGIETVDYDGTNGVHFRLVESGDLDEPRHTTVRPALLHAGALLRRGEARIPAATPLPQQEAVERLAGHHAEHPTDELPKPQDRKGCSHGDYV